MQMQPPLLSYPQVQKCDHGTLSLALTTSAKPLPPRLDTGWKSECPPGPSPWPKTGQFGPESGLESYCELLFMKNSEGADSGPEGEGILPLPPHLSPTKRPCSAQPLKSLPTCTPISPVKKGTGAHGGRFTGCHPDFGKESPGKGGGMVSIFSIKRDQFFSGMKACCYSR